MILWVIMKIVKNRDSKDTFVEFITKCYTEKASIQEKNVLEYIFINKGDVVCYVNNFPLDPQNIAPGVNTYYHHRFETSGHEFDYTKYSIYFEK